MPRQQAPNITREQIIQVFVYEGNSKDKAAELFGITPNQLQYLILKYKIRKIDHPTIIDKKVDEAVERYTNGESLKNIAKSLHMDHDNLRIHLSNRGIYLRSLELNIINKKIGKLFVIEKIENGKYLCKCDCGVEKICKKGRLLDGRNTSCGCNMIKSRENSGSWSGYKEITGTYWSSILHGAKSRNLEFSITIKEIWDLYIKQDKKCIFTKLPITMPQSKQNKQIKLNQFSYLASLDRIDSSKGYVTNNIQWVIREINMMKQSLCDNIFINLCKLVTDGQSV